MKTHLLTLVIAVCALTGASPAQADTSIYEPYCFTTLAGLALNSGTTDNTGSLARFNQPWGLAVDGANNVYVGDTLNQTIRKITPGGVVTTLAGVAGSTGSANGAAGSALFSRPTGVAVNSAGTVVFVADYNNHLIRQISGGVVSTLAGSVGVFGTSDGTGTAAQFRNPFGVAVNSAGTVVYVTDMNNQTIRAITVPGGVVTTLAGSPNVNGSTDGANSVARFNTPRGIAVDSGGNIFVADAGNLTVRKILSSGGVSTLAGAVFTPGFNDGPGLGARFSNLQVISPFGGPCGVAVDSGGNIYVTDQGSIGAGYTIRKITPGGSVTTLAGAVGVAGSADGTGLAAGFNLPAGVAVSSAGRLHVADTVNHTIRIQCEVELTTAPELICATNRIVASGSTWDFDAPSVTSPSGTNFTIVVLNTVTNIGPSGTVITRTWQVTGFCVTGTKSWSPLGAGMNDEVWALMEMGGNLYAGGHFTTAGGGSANHVAKWNGASWSPLGSGITNGLNGPVSALAATGGKLFAGGYFTTAGGVPATNIAQWDGTSWSALGSPLVSYSAVEALAVIGTDLYVGGGFDVANGGPGNRIAKFDTLTSVWSPLGSGMNDRVNSLKVIGTDLYAGGQFTNAGGVSANFVAKWNGSTWSALGSGMNLRVGGSLGVLAGNLYAGGVFTTAGGNAANRVAKWDVSTSSWSALGTGMNGEVEGFAVIGTDLYASGGFATAGGVSADRVARWDGSTWSPLGTGMNDGVWRLAVIGTDLYAGGIFTTAGGLGANYVAKWGGDCLPVSVTCSQTVTVLAPPVPCVETNCIIFETSTATNGFTGYLPCQNATPGVALTLNVPGPSGATNDYYLHARDLSGASTIQNLSAFNGNYLCLASNLCAEFCFDFRLFVDGDPGHLSITPSFVLLSDSDGPCGTNPPIRAHWVASFAVTEDGGTNAGWHRICIPIKPLINGNLPSSAEGSWQMLDGKPNTDWDVLLASVTGLVLPIDFTSSPSEEVGYDNFCFSATNCCVAAPPNMVLWLPFDETNGIISANLVPGGSSGTQVNGPVAVNGYVAHSLSFDGVNQYVEVPSYNAINFDTNDFSIDAWVRRATNDPGTSVRIIVDKRDELGTVRGYAFFLGSGGTLGFQLADGSFANYSSSLAVANDGQWHHVAVTVDRDNPNGIVFYLDGVAGTGVHNPVPHQASVSTPFPLRVGSRSSSVSFNFFGGIDEVELFSRVLGTNEVVALFNAGVGGKCKPACAIPLVVLCPTNKTVNCGTAWTFDAPTAASCCSTNVTITPSGLVTNGVCPQLITQSWLINDDCGNSNICSQTVTVRDLQPPTITCPTNKTVTCGTAWTFDEPTASDTCSGTNVAITILNTVTNGSCSPVVTRTWLAMDACGNTNSCSQTVTVLAPPPCVACETWIPRETIRDWYSVSSSADGSKLVAVVNGGQIYTSTDSGTNWTAHETNRNWQSVASSADGSKLVAVVNGGQIYTSIDSGTSWTARDTNRNWISVASSADGTKLVAANNGGQMYTSSDSGFTWTPHGGNRNWTSVASSADGSKLVVVVFGDKIYTSSDYGVNWTAHESNRGWWSVASSADGSKLVAANTSDRLHTSSDFGVNWTARDSNRNWRCVASSADGSKLVAGVRNGKLYCSTDSGVTWTAHENNREWQGVASSSSGNNLVAVEYAGRIYTAACAETPVLNCSTNKTVNCGTAWTFDAPTATDACSGTNVTITILNTATNGSCPQVITRTWKATDACGNTNTCSQTVTVVDDTMPVISCATNKTVTSGTAWTFDAPTASDACSGTNVIIFIYTVTNGVCPQVITRTWLAMDACGNCDTCSQTVTVVDGTPPVVTCPTNRIYVALNTNCQLEIPTIRPPASDNCTPARQLVYTQNPAAGAIVVPGGPCQPVTVTVTDANGNASQCQVLVCGYDGTPPVLICPKSVTVTNCVVPNVLALVSASDNCTASNQLVFTQSPLVGTTIAAGGNSVTVTVTDQSGNAATCVIPLISSALHSFLDVLFNTGVDSSKAVLLNASVDSHYTLGPVPAGAPTGAGFYNAPNAIVTTVYPPTALPSPFSTWITPAANSVSFPAGSYTYTNQFTLPSGANPLSASISGRWAADNGARMYLNGLAPANQVSFIAPPTGYNQWTYFTAGSGFLAFSAVNTLYFVVTNQGPYTGLRVEFTNAVINCSTCSPPFILLQTPDQSRPLGGTATFNVTAWGTPPLTLQWYHNGLPLANGGHYSGVNLPTLTITPVSYVDAGSYYAVISNACGSVTSHARKLTVTFSWPWWWGWWNFAQIGRPLVATVGPDLIMEGTNDLGISSGTTYDFDLPNLGGKIVNVMHVPPLPGDTLIKLPLVAPEGSGSVSNYTLIMDVYAPSNSTERATFFTIFDRWGNLVLSCGPRAADEELSVSGMVGDMAFNLDSPMPLLRGTWNRIALVVENIFNSGAEFGDEVTLSLYVNGKPVGRTSFSAAAGALAFSSDSVATVFSSPEGTDRELYVASLQFHAVAMTPEMMAGIGSPDNGPIPANDTSVGVLPVLSATTASGSIKLAWENGRTVVFLLQETSDLTSGDWMDSKLPFDQAEVNGEIITTARANPALEGPRKFFRLFPAP